MQMYGGNESRLLPDANQKLQKSNSSVSGWSSGSLFFKEVVKM